MKLFSREILWRDPYELERLPALNRLHQRSFEETHRLRQKLLRFPLFKTFPWLYRLGIKGEGRFHLTESPEKSLPFNARNLQFSSLYMPQHRGGYEAETTALLSLLVDRDCVFYDVGSNWGYFSLYLASRPQFQGKVHAFEPQEDSFRDLSGLVSSAGLGSKIECHRVGLSDRSAHAHMVIPDGLHSGSATLSEHGMDIELKRLDDLGLEEPDVIKLDVENHECQAILGGKSTFSRAHPHLLFESWLRPSPAETMEAFRLLEDMGYKFFRPIWLQKDGDKLYPAPQLRPTDGQKQIIGLVPFEPLERLLMEEQLNILASHPQRLQELEKAFSTEDRTV